MPSYLLFLTDPLHVRPSAGGSLAEWHLARLPALPPGPVVVRASEETGEAVRALGRRLERPVEVVVGSPVARWSAEFFLAVAEQLRNGGTEPTVIVPPWATGFDAAMVEAVLEGLDATGAEATYVEAALGWEVLAARPAWAETLGRLRPRLLEAPRPGAVDQEGRYRPVETWRRRAHPPGSNWWRLRWDLKVSPRGLDRLEACARAVGKAPGAIEARDVWAAMEARGLDLLSLHPESLLVELTSEAAAAPAYWPTVAAPATVRRERPRMDGPTFEHVTRLIEKAADTRLKVSFAGLGDPLDHPEVLPWARSLWEAVRRSPSPPAALSLETFGAGLSEEVANLLVEEILPCTQTNLLVRLDAADPDLYARLHPGGPPYEAVAERFRRLLEIKKERMRRHPSWRFYDPETGVSIALLPETRDHVDSFFAAWPCRDEETSRPGGPSLEEFYRDRLPLEHVVLVSPSDYAGRIPDRRAADYTPLRRMPCRRLSWAVTVLCDGTVSICDRVLSVDGATAIGKVTDFASLGEIWAHPTLADLRRAHAEGRFDAHPLCVRCRDWHVPVD